MPGLVLLHFLALAKAARTEVDLFALFCRAFDPDSVCDVDTTYI